MRHRKSGRKFGRNSSHRRATFRNMAASLIMHEKIQTTHAKAMELRGIVEKLISKAAKAGDSVGKPLDKLNVDERARQVHLRRTLGKFLPRFYGDGENNSVFEMLFFDLAPRFKERPGGYTRVTKIGPRRGDNAPMSIIELLSED